MDSIRNARSAQDIVRERESDVRVINALIARLANVYDGSALYLRSPDGTRWKIEVDNAGNLTTTAV